MKMQMKLAVGLAVWLFLFCMAGLRTANADTVTFDITVFDYSPSSDVTYSYFSIDLFEYPYNAWPNYVYGSVEFIPDGGGGGVLNPGSSEFVVTVSVTNPSDLYISMYAWVNQFEPVCGPAFSLFAAESPMVPDWEAWGYGPPWISLANLEPGSGLSGQFEWVEGYSESFGPWQITETPEPPSLLLVVGFLLSFAGLNVLRKKFIPSLSQV